MTAAGAADVGVALEPDRGLRPQDVGLGQPFWDMCDALVIGEAASGRIALWNPAAEALFGYAASEAIGQSLELLIPEPLRPAHRAGIARYAATGEGALVEARAPVELPARRKGGEEIAVELTLTPIPRARVPGRYVLAVIRDATARRRLEREREALLSAAHEQNRKLGDQAHLKDEFTAMVAHELGAPIAAIRALADLLAADQLTADQRGQALATIRREADALRTLVGDVQAALVAERDDFAVYPFSVALDLMLADTAAFARTLPGDHPFACPLDTGLRVQADPERIAQVLRNLLGNAAKYSPPGAPIEVRVERRDARAWIEVVDRGFGIGAEDLERIFEKFARGRDGRARKVPGHGLGLYLSRRIVQAHGADLTARSVPGEGSVFGFDLEVVR